MIPSMISACPFALTPELVIAIATAALAIATVILASVTAWMAWETRRTSQTATKALSLEQMPILGVRDLKTRTTTPPSQLTTLASIKVGIELFNAGRLPVKFRVKRMAVTLANKHASTGVFASTGGRILPGGSTTFWHPILALNPPISTLPADGDVSFEYEYSDDAGDQLKFITGKITYTISSSSPFGFYVEWLHVD